MSILSFIPLFMFIFIILIYCGYNYVTGSRFWNVFVNEPENQPFDVPEPPGGATKLVNIQLNPHNPNNNRIRPWVIAPNALRTLTSLGIPVTQADLDELSRVLRQSDHRIRTVLKQTVVMRHPCCKGERITPEVVLAAYNRALNNLNRSYFSDKNMFVDYWATRDDYEGHYPPLITFTNDNPNRSSFTSECLRFYYYGPLQAPTAGVTGNPAILSPGLTLV